MKLLDLFSGAGGAAAGYRSAGFEVIGVDIAPQPRYAGDRFIQGDALELLLELGHTVDAVHASPPCQPYSSHVTSADSPWVPTRGRNEPALIGATRDLLRMIGKPYVIENVAGRRARAELREPVLLCGSMFGLPIPRHRLFEASFPLPQPAHPASCRGLARRSAEALGYEYRDMTVTGKGRHAGTTGRWRHLLGIEAYRAGRGPATAHELAEAIPPAYTAYVGDRLATILTGRLEAARHGIGHGLESELELRFLWGDR